MRETKVGVVEHYFPRRKAALVRIEERGLHLGDVIHIVGHGCDLVERVLAMEIDHEPVQDAHGGQLVGVEVNWPAREGAAVFIAEPEFAGDWP
ncbi:MAG TPA: hypothetical protein VI818_00230 [Candidatus Thermoplasmatota archaeon]|nr:hypothetical protein [Candidatus Thermoplasmatota archaeon]